jgi:phosphatidylserine synthase
MFKIVKKINEKNNKEAQEFIKKLHLESEHRIFVGTLLITILLYFLITFWLNNIRETASLWIIWVLIIIQFLLYFKIFYKSYRRFLDIKYNSGISFFIILILFILGRINDWEVAVIPLLFVIMFFCSINTRNLPTDSE